MFGLEPSGDFQGRREASDGDRSVGLTRGTRVAVGRHPFRGARRIGRSHPTRSRQSFSRQQHETDDQPEDDRGAAQSAEKERFERHERQQPDCSPDDVVRPGGPPTSDSTGKHVGERPQIQPAGDHASV